MGEVQIIVPTFVRDPVKLAVSLYQQYALIPGGIYTPESFLRDWGHQTYRRHLENLATFFTDDEISFHSFEEAVQSKKGLVGYFLEFAGLTGEEIDTISFRRSNQARSAEVIELLLYIQQTEPLLLPTPSGGTKKNAKRAIGDVYPVLGIKGTPFDLPYQEKKMLLQKSREDIFWLKHIAGIDYTNSKVSAQKDISPCYKTETLKQFSFEFSKLTNEIKSIFVQFFHNKYNNEGDAKFLFLFQETGSVGVNYQYALAFQRLLDQHPQCLQGVDVHYDGVHSLVVQDYAQLFLDCGDGFIQEDSYTFYQNPNRVTRFSLQINPKQQITRFRIDPSCYPCIVKKSKLWVNGKDDNYHLTDGNHNDHYNDIFSFYSDDPRICYESIEFIRSIDLELLVDSGTYPFVFSVKKSLCEIQQYRAETIIQTNLVAKQEQQIQEQVQQIQEQAQQIQEQAQQIQEQAILAHQYKVVHQSETTNLLQKLEESSHNLMSSEEQIQKLSQKLLEVQQSYTLLLESTSWKITKPLRKIKNCIKRLFR